MSAAVCTMQLAASAFGAAANNETMPGRFGIGAATARNADVATDRKRQARFGFSGPGGKRHFWEELQYRDPLVDHVHSSLPGHPLDFLIHQHIRGPSAAIIEDAGRIECWGFYCEEMLLQVD